MQKLGWILMAACSLALVAYQYIVFEYTRGDRPPPPGGEWQKYLIVAVSGFGVAGAFVHLSTLASNPDWRQVAGGVIAALPACLLLAYALHSNSDAAANKADWRRQFLHVYVGLTLLLMAVSALASVPYLIAAKR